LYAFTESRNLEVAWSYGHGLGQGSKDFYIKVKNKNKYVAATVLRYTVFWRADGIAFCTYYYFLLKKTTCKPNNAVLDEQPLG
jgi:hypothetical protein